MPRPTLKPKELAASLRRRLTWLNLPTGALIAFLQRSPAAQAVSMGLPPGAVSPVASVLKSAAAVAASLGAVDALAGATTLIESNSEPSLSVSAGAPIQDVVFGVTNTINIGSWQVGGTMPPGLRLAAAQGGASLAGPGVLDATNAQADIYNTTPILEGTPTAPGVYTLTLQAFEYGALQGLASNVFSYTVTVAGSGSSSSGSGSSSSGAGSSSGGSGAVPSSADRPPVPSISVDGHGSGDTLTLAAGASGLFQIAVHYKATDASANLSGIRFNYWNPPAGNPTPGMGLFSNGGGGFFPQSGGSGEVDENVILTPGTWYFWTDAQNANGDYASTGAWTAGYVLNVVQGSGSVTTTTPAPSDPTRDAPPVPGIAVDGHLSGDTLTVPAGGSATVTVRYSATDASNNLSGIRYNIWNPPAANPVPGQGYFSNGNGFAAQSGGSGQVSVVESLTPGDWYVWTDAQNANGDYASTGAWTAGYVLHVVASP